MYYVLNEHGDAVPCDLMTWARRLESTNRIVQQDTIGGVFVSTVFLGLDHNFGHGPPLLFETMIFDGFHDNYQERYSTYDEAIEGHARAMDVARQQSQDPELEKYLKAKAHENPPSG